MIRSPKIYFLDTGLACRLQGWTEREPLFNSPQIGFLFENFVFSEMYKCHLNHQKDWRFYHWRTREGEEVDFLIEKENQTYQAIEVKLSSQGSLTIPKSFSREFSNPHSQKNFINFFICHLYGEKFPHHVSIKNLKEFLLSS